MLIHIQHLTKFYTEKRSGLKTKALDDINLDIQEGDFVAIAGPSGSGKTTLLNLIGGLDKPSSGTLIVDGISLASLNSSALADFRLKKIGFVFQAYNLIPTLTAFENTEYTMLLQGIPRDKRWHETFATLADLGLAAYTQRRPSELSSGQQQRLAIARAVLAQPKIILADEPTANLDSKTGADLIESMASMGKNLGITFIFATHDPMITEKARTLIRLRDGKVL